MKTIHKYSINWTLLTDTFCINMPEYAEILTCQMRYGRPVIWALVDESVPKHIMRTFRIIGAKNQIKDSEKLKYISTIQIDNGQLVFHIFEAIQPINN